MYNKNQNVLFINNQENKFNKFNNNKFNKFNKNKFNKFNKNKFNKFNKNKFNKFNKNKFNKFNNNKFNKFSKNKFNKFNINKLKKGSLLRKFKTDKLFNKNYEENLKEKYKKLSEFLYLKNKKGKKKKSFLKNIKTPLRLKQRFKRALKYGHINSLKYNKYNNLIKLNDKEKDPVKSFYIKYKYLLKKKIIKVKRFLTFFQVFKFNNKKYIDKNGNLQRIKKNKKVISSKYLWKSLITYNNNAGYYNFEFDKILDNNNIFINSIKKKVSYNFFKNWLSSYTKYTNQYQLVYYNNIKEFNIGKWDLAFYTFNNLKSDNNNKFLFLCNNNFIYYLNFYSNLTYNIFNKYNNVIQLKNKVYNALLYKRKIKYNLENENKNISFLYINNNIDLKGVYKKYKKHISLWNNVLINQRKWAKHPVYQWIFNLLEFSTYMNLKMNLPYNKINKFIKNISEDNNIQQNLYMSDYLINKNKNYYIPKYWIYFSTFLKNIYNIKFHMLYKSNIAILKKNFLNKYLHLFKFIKYYLINLFNYFKFSYLKNLNFNHFILKLRFYIFLIFYRTFTKFSNFFCKNNTDDLKIKKNLLSKNKLNIDAVNVNLDYPGFFFLKHENQYPFSFNIKKQNIDKNKNEYYGVDVWAEKHFEKLQLYKLQHKISIFNKEINIKNPFLKLNKLKDKLKDKEKYSLGLNNVYNQFFTWFKYNPKWDKKYVYKKKKNNFLKIEKMFETAYRGENHFGRKWKNIIGKYTPEGSLKNFSQFFYKYLSNYSSCSTLSKRMVKNIRKSIRKKQENNIKHTSWINFTIARLNGFIKQQRELIKFMKFLLKYFVKVTRELTEKEKRYYIKSEIPFIELPLISGLNYFKWQNKMDEALKIPQFKDRIIKISLIYKKITIQNLLVNKKNVKYKNFSKIFKQYQVFLKKLSMQFIKEKIKNKKSSNKFRYNQQNKNKNKKWVE